MYGTRLARADARSAACVCSAAVTTTASRALPSRVPVNALSRSSASAAPITNLTVRGGGRMCGGALGVLRRAC